MRPKKFYSFLQGGREADIHIFGDIVRDQYVQSDVSADSLSQQIETLDADVINVYIDSYGGVLSEGWAIYNQLRQHPAFVRTYGIGFVASAALYPFLAGDERYAVEPSAYFLHQVVVGADGYADDLRTAADMADQMTEIGLAPFAQAGVSLDAVREMMRAETWLSPQGALECGIATGVLTNRQSARMTQSAKSLVIQRVLRPDPPPERETSEDQDPPETSEPITQTAGIMGMLGGVFDIRK